MRKLEREKNVYFDGVLFQLTQVIKPKLILPALFCLIVTKMEGNRGDQSDVWELSKENVQPLKTGRKFSNLTAALQITMALISEMPTWET